MSHLFAERMPAGLDAQTLGAAAVLAIDSGLLVGAGHIVAELDGPLLDVSDHVQEFEAVAAAAWSDLLGLAAAE